MSIMTTSKRQPPALKVQQPVWAMCKFVRLSSLPSGEQVFSIGFCRTIGRRAAITKKWHAPGAR